MARDFRPKAAKKAGKAQERVAKEVEQKEKGMGAEGSDDEVSSNAASDDDEDDETLLAEIRALGGDESDLKLIKGIPSSSKQKLDEEDEEVDPALQKELHSFMKALNFKALGPVQDAVVEEDEVIEVKSKAEKKKAKKEERKRQEQQEKAALTEPKPEEVVPAVELKRKGAYGFVVVPSSRWDEIEIPDLTSLTTTKKITTLTDAAIKSMQERADQMLTADRSLYSQLTNSGKTGSGGEGLLSASDAKFVADLLGSGSRSGTLSDRIAALALLAQTSPVHNFDSLERLLDMAGKKGREESGRATRSLGDWLASEGGLPKRKLRYFRDQAHLAILAAAYNDATVRGKDRLNVDLALVMYAFEDRLKRFYFDFLQVLERQSHDTLPFVRKQAAGQIFVLLRDKAEQEQNLLRLLVNKLGDSDRGVASKASSHLLSLLNSHPAMKAVVTNEVSNLVLRAPSALSHKGKATPNAHAQYYGVLTLNQTMLTNNDVDVANGLVTLYFTLFEGLLKEMAKSDRSEDKKDGGQDDDDKQASEAPPVAKRDKGRWRDTGRGGKTVGAKGGRRKEKAKERAADPVQEADARIVAAVLAGVRRALPFAKMDGVVVERHMDTLFRITHSSTFNISIQALQLIFQVSSSGGTAKGSSTSLQDRFYRTLYASMMDPRLAKTSKQAMYLNLLFRATKSDLNDARSMAFVKRLCQLLTNSEPPFICGSLFLLGEIFRAKPGLQGMLKDAEEEGEEHFVDVDESGDESSRKNVDDSTLSMQALRDRSKNGYDGDKRDPRFARADSTCLWDLIPLLSHFHPSVALCASQLLMSQPINATADLTLHTLSHFLDRFVYRNPKKRIAPSKGASLMQPALHVNDGLETGVARLRGQGIGKEEFVNSEAFWRKKAIDVPADQLFFHKFFNLRNAPSTTQVGRGRAVGAEEDAIDGEEDQDDGDDVSAGDQSDQEDEEDSDLEREIGKEMRRTMPRQKGDEMLDEVDDDEDDGELDADLMASSDDDEVDDEEEVDDTDEGDEDDLSDDLLDEDVTEEEEEEDDDDDDDDLSDNAFDEDDDDLLPYQFQSDNEAPTAGQKRKADEPEEGEATTKSKSQLQREQRKRQKALPTFATAEDYAHLLGNSDDEQE